MAVTDEDTELWVYRFALSHLPDGPVLRVRANGVWFVVDAHDDRICEFDNDSGYLYARAPLG